MLHIAVGSLNPAKVEAVQNALQTMGLKAEVAGFNAASGVSNQPFSDEETIKGAINRATAALRLNDQTDYGIGLEGGVVETSFGMFLCNWGAVVNQKGDLGIGGGHRIMLPAALANALKGGQELGDVIDQWAQGENIKKKEGTIGILTQNLITRKKMFHDVVICSFARFLRERD